MTWVVVAVLAARPDVFVAESCRPEVTARSLRDALSLELGALAREVQTYVAAHRPRLEVSCEGDDVTARTVVDEVADTEHLDRRRSDLVRFLAITAAQDLAARASAPAPREHKPTVQSIWVARVGGGVAATGTPAQWQGTAALGVAWQVSLLSVEARAAFGHGRLDLPPGTLRETWVTGQLQLMVQAALGPLRLGAGVGGRGGVLIWAGAANEGVEARTAAAGLAGVLAAARVGVSLTPWLLLELDGEVGTLLRGATLDFEGTRLVTTAPGWLALRLGFCFVFT